MTAPSAGPGLSLQDRYAPANACFGCGPQNPKGLRLKSYVRAPPDAGTAEPAAHATSSGPGAAARPEVVADFQPEPHHQAFPGMLNGGIIGALLDCHSNWTAAYSLMCARGANSPPCTVTAEFHVKLKAPTPMDRPVRLRAWPVSIAGDRCSVEAELSSGGKVTATCRGTFVAVKEGHPAYHRW